MASHQSKHGGRRLSERLSQRGARNTGRSTNKEQTTPLVALASTSWPFFRYIDSCPDLLKQLGIFRQMFDKWPADDALQAATARLEPNACMNARRSRPHFAFRSGFVCCQRARHEAMIMASCVAQKARHEAMTRGSRGPTLYGKWGRA